MIEFAGDSGEWHPLSYAAAGTAHFSHQITHSALTNRKIASLRLAQTTVSRWGTAALVQEAALGDILLVIRGLSQPT
jgi:hypothetical protein